MRNWLDRHSVLALYAVVFFSWSGAWFATKLQVGEIAPIVSIAWRFGLAVPIMFAWVAWRGDPLKFGWQQQRLFAVMGVFLFSVNFLFAYQASLFLVSALLSVVFSLSTVINLVLGALLFNERAPRAAVVGALAGTAGLLCIVWPELSAQGAGRAPWWGLLLALGMTVSFCIGNMAASHMQKALKVPVASATAWAMLWGSSLSATVALLTGHRITLLWTPAYLGSLAFLVILGTVVAFHAYLTLLGRVGGFRAAYVNVLVPVGALLISSFFENYQWTVWAAFGVALTLGGNVLILRARQAPAPQPAPTAPQVST